MTATTRYHAALHLGHRWFAFLEAPGGDLQAHLGILHPEVRLTGRRGEHVFAINHASLAAWFNSIPDEASSHHIVHSDYCEAGDGRGRLRMVVAYQAPGADGVHGSIISYETQIGFTSDGPRFLALDKTPILPNTRATYEPSWATHRVLALVHATLGDTVGSSEALRSTLGADLRQVRAQVTAAEGSRSYDALLTGTGPDPADLRAWRLAIHDDGHAPFPRLAKVELLGSS